MFWLSFSLVTTAVNYSTTAVNYSMLASVKFNPGLNQLFYCCLFKRTVVSRSTRGIFKNNVYCCFWEER